MSSDGGNDEGGVMGRRCWHVVAAVLATCVLLIGAGGGHAAEPALMRDLELEALQEAVRWRDADVGSVVALVGRFIAGRRDGEAYAYFRERAERTPDRPLFLALEGFFQARIAGDIFLLRRATWVNEAVAKLDRAVARDPGLPRYFRGLVLAELPARFGKATAAVADLQWVLQTGERFPVGLRRSVHRGLARAYTTLGRQTEARAALERSGSASLDPSLPIFTTDAWVTASVGFRFRPPRLVQPVPGIYIAQGYDFADIAFVITAEGIVAIDAGTIEANARAALAALREATQKPITHVILTHAHWDHVGGLAALKGPDTQVIAQEGFAQELKIVNETGVPFRYFFGSEAPRRYDVVPDRLVARRETLTVGGTELVLYPVRGAETEDALLIHVPERGVLFVGDTFMPYLGAPFLPEGSPEALFENIALIRSLEPRLLIHGHPPLTELFTVETLAGFEAAMRDLHARTLARIAEGRALADIRRENILPEVLRQHPAVLLRYLVVRDNFIARVHHQRTGYWKADGEGIEVVAPGEWAGALDLLGGRREAAFADTVRTLLARGDDALALKLADLGLIKYPSSRTLADLRRRALDQLRARHQQLNPFKFIIYSEWAGADLRPAE
jgi:glyoxylase-like metal-dependent hydrolase (beta-lactamase superfamily II)